MDVDQATRKAQVDYDRLDAYVRMTLNPQMEKLQQSNHQLQQQLKVAHAERREAKLQRDRNEAELAQLREMEESGPDRPDEAARMQRTLESNGKKLDYLVAQAAYLEDFVKAGAEEVAKSAKEEVQKVVQEAFRAGKAVDQLRECWERERSEEKATFTNLLLEILAKIDETFTRPLSRESTSCPMDLEPAAPADDLDRELLRARLEQLRENYDDLRARYVRLEGFVKYTVDSLVALARG